MNDEERLKILETHKDAELLLEILKKVKDKAKGWCAIFKNLDDFGELSNAVKLSNSELEENQELYNSICKYASDSEDGYLARNNKLHRVSIENMKDKQKGYRAIAKNPMVSWMKRAWAVGELDPNPELLENQDLYEDVLLSEDDSGVIMAALDGIADKQRGHRALAKNSSRSSYLQKYIVKSVNELIPGLAESEEIYEFLCANSDNKAVRTASLNNMQDKQKGYRAIAKNPNAYWKDRLEAVQALDPNPKLFENQQTYQHIYINDRDSEIRAEAKKNIAPVI